MKFRILEKIVGVNGEDTLREIESKGYEFVRRTTNYDFYRKEKDFIIYDARTDTIKKRFKIT